MESLSDYDQFFKNIDDLVLTDELYEFLNKEELLNYINCIYEVLREEEQNVC